jgi:hypothetical protein
MKRLGLMQSFVVIWSELWSEFSMKEWLRIVPKLLDIRPTQVLKKKLMMGADQTLVF